MVRVLDPSAVAQDLNIAERPKVLFGSADLLGAAVVMDEGPLRQIDIG
jgi:hypothetical protein